MTVCLIILWYRSVYEHLNWYLILILAPIQKHTTYKSNFYHQTYTFFFKCQYDMVWSFMVIFLSEHSLNCICTMHLQPPFLIVIMIIWQFKARTRIYRIFYMYSTCTYHYTLTECILSQFNTNILHPILKFSSLS